MRYIILCLMCSLFVIGCNRKSAPPIQLDVIAPAVTKQLKDQFPDYFVKVGKVQYDASVNIYHVEVFTKVDGQEMRYVMAFLRAQDNMRNLTMYAGQLPSENVGVKDPNGRKWFTVTIDPLLNP